MQVRLTHHAHSRDSTLLPITDERLGLILQYKIQLIRCEPTTHFNAAGTYCTGNGILHDEFGRFHLEAWSDAEWTEFRNQFANIVTRHWDDKFELTPNQAWYPARGPANVTAAAVKCHLSLELVNNAAAAHHRYFIIKPRETNFRSFAAADRRLGLFTHRDLALGWNDRRTRVGHERHSVSYLQSTVLHEFGHTLGLGHVNGAGNSDANYGTTLEQRDDMMGMGDHLTARHASPWRTQLRHHLVPGHNRHDAALRFTARVTAPQLITYWDNDWRPAAAAPAAGAAAHP